MFTEWFKTDGHNDQMQTSAFDTNDTVIQQRPQPDHDFLPGNGPNFTVQQQELARLKTIKQACLILGIVFSIIGLISMCNHPTQPNEDSSVARKMESVQLENIDS